MPRGRKPKQNNRFYFMQEQEDAVLAYLDAQTPEEKNRIYRNQLHRPFSKMVEAIIRKYKLYIPDESYEETYTEALSFLVQKLDKFKPGKHKAYSYYGTVCKNHLIGRIQDAMKEATRVAQYDTVPNSINNSIRYSDAELSNSRFSKELMGLLIDRVKLMIGNPERFKLKEKELTMGNALVKLFENWEYVLSTDGSNKLNKSAILFYLKEATDFDAKGIRDAMRKFKKEFYEIKKEQVRL